MKIIQTQNLVEHFFGSLDSCIANLKTKPLLYEMNKKYPGLNEEMKKTMNLYKRRKNRFYIKCKLYLISPELYIRFMLLKRRLKILMSGAIKR
jgi:hypothetical protein